MTENIRVAVRVRPLNQRELSYGGQWVVNMNEQNVFLKFKENDERSFAFDDHFWSHDSQSEAKEGELAPEEGL